MEDECIEPLRPHKHQGQDSSNLLGGEKVNGAGEGYLSLWKLYKEIGVNVAKILFLEQDGEYKGLSYS